MKYGVKGLSAFDWQSTGPFNSYEEAKRYLMQHSDIDHINKHFGTKEKWCEFMIFEIKDKVAK